MPDVNAFVDSLGLPSGSGGSSSDLANMPQDFQPTTLPGKIWKGVGDILGTPANILTRGVYLPVAQAMTAGDEAAQARLEALKGFKRPLFLGDILQASGSPLTSTSTDPLATRIAKGIGRFGADVAGDPLTYVSFGATTALGKTAKAIEAAKEAGQTIKLGSKVAEEASRLTGEPASANLIRTFEKSLEGKPLPEQIRAGQRSFASASLPFTNLDVPIIGGEIGARLAQPFSAIARSKVVTTISNAARELLSSATGNASYDRLVSNYKDLAMHRAGLQIQDAKSIEAKMKDLSTNLGIPREELNKQITDLVEQLKPAEGLPSKGVPFNDNDFRAALKVGGKVYAGGGTHADAWDIIPQAVKDKYKLGEDLGDSSGGNLISGYARKGNPKEFYTEDEFYELTKKSLPIDSTTQHFMRMLESSGAKPKSQIPEWVTSNLKAQGKNPARLFNDLDFAQYKDLIAQDPWVKEIQQTNPELAQKILQGNVTRQELKEFATQPQLPLQQVAQRIADEKLPVRGESYSAAQTLDQAKSFLKEQDEDQWDFPFIITPEDRVMLGKWDHRSDFNLPEVKGFAEDLNSGAVKAIGRFNIDKEGRISDFGNDIESGSGFLIGQGEEHLKKALQEWGAKLDPDSKLGISRLLSKEELLQGKVTDEDMRWGDIKNAYQPVKQDLVDPAVKQMANEIRERQARQLALEQTSGIRAIPLLADRDYIAHVATTEARSAIRDQMVRMGTIVRGKGIGVKEFNDKFANQLRREFVTVNKDVVKSWVKSNKFEFLVHGQTQKALLGDNGLEHLDDLLDKEIITPEEYTQAVHTLSVQEVNQMAQEGKLTKLLGDYKGPLFEEDPVYSTTIRGIRGEKARTSGEFFQEVKDRGIALPIAKAPADWVPVNTPQFEGMAAPLEVAKHLRGWNNFTTNPDELNKFLRVYDNVQNDWKAWTQAIFPAYHIRNFVGNMWNNWLGGVDTIKPYQLATKMQAKSPFEFVDALGKIWNHESILKAAQERGVVDKGWVGADIPRTISDELSGGKWLTLSRRNVLVKKGFEVGKSIENNARAAMFIDRLMKGDTAEEAAMQVKKYLFDYSDLSDFERQGLKRLFPFYTWTRKNVPLQIQHLITEPAKISSVFKIQNEAEAGVQAPPGGQEKYLPQYVSENFPSRVRYDDKTNKYQYFMWGSWLPALDIAKMINLHDTVAGMLAPIPKEMLQQLFNYDFYMKSKIEKYPGATEPLAGIELPAKITHGAKLLRVLREIDNMTRQDKTLSTKIAEVATGRTTEYDPMKGLLSNKLQVMDDIAAMKTNIKRESLKPKPNQALINRIIGQINDRAKDLQIPAQ